MVNIKTFNLDNESAVYYYIHRHIKHFEKDAAMALFQEQKNINYQIMKNRFKKNYLENINSVSRDGLNILDAAMKEEEILNGLDRELLETLNDSVSEAIKSYNFDKKVKTAYNSLNSFINTQDAKALDKLFSQISSATKLLTTNKNELTFLLGIKKQYAQNRDLNALYNYIQKGIEQLDNKIIKVNSSAIQSVNNSLLQLVGDLSQKKFNKQSLNGYIKNIFSTQIGEYIVSKGLGKAIGLLPSAIMDYLSGTKNIEVDGDLELQELISNYGQQGNQVFKTDNSFKDLSIKVNSGDVVDINLGISTKWYKGSNSGNIYDVSIATETSFISRINQMLKNPIENYYAYNALGLAGQDNELYSALKAALVARNLDVLISGLGVQGDFAQYLVINGEFYSIWQIINAIEYLNQGQGSYSRGDKTDPITISATGLSKVISLTSQAQDEPNNLTKAFVRSKKQNQLIEELGLSAHFYPNRLKNALLSSKI